MILETLLYCGTLSLVEETTSGISCDFGDQNKRKKYVTVIRWVPLNTKRSGCHGMKTELGMFSGLLSITSGTPTHWIIFFFISQNFRHFRLGRGSTVGQRQYCEITSTEPNTPTDFYLMLGSHGPQNTIDWLIHLPPLPFFGKFHLNFDWVNSMHTAENSENITFFVKHKSVISDILKKKEVSEVPVMYTICTLCINSLHSNRYSSFPISIFQWTEKWSKFIIVLKDRFFLPKYVALCNFPVEKYFYYYLNPNIQYKLLFAPF